MAPRKRNAAVGFIVLVAALAMGWMILKFSSTTVSSLVEKGTEFAVLSDRADGLADGAPVYYLGVGVGRITDVQRLPNNQQVRIAAVLNQNESLPANLSGVIRQQSQLGSSSALHLYTDGPPSGQKLVSGAQLPAHHAGTGIVPAEFTDLARDLRQQQLIRHVDEAVVEMRTQFQKAGSVLESANRLVGDPKMRQDVQATIASVRSASDRLDQFTGRLNDVTTQTQGTMKELNDRLRQFSVVLDRFQSVADKVDKGTGTAGLLINDTRLYESLADTSKEMNLTVRDLRRLIEQWEEEGFKLKLK